jgi:hypothetical protein
MATELQVRLTGLSAPGQLIEWARPFPDLESCWKACTTPEFLLWLAARLCTTTEERRAVVSCLAELTRLAERSSPRASSPVDAAASTAETWARTGASLDDLLAAERAALDVAAWAAIVAAEEGARARMLFRSAPRGRPASLGTSRALGALADWREANRTQRLALAAASTARAAAEAVRADAAAADAGTGSPGEPGSSPGSWEARVTESAGYAVSALAHSRPAGRDDRSARKAARLIRRRLPCPRLD